MVIMFSLWFVIALSCTMVAPTVIYSVAVFAIGLLVL